MRRPIPATARQNFPHINNHRRLISATTVRPTLKRSLPTTNRRNPRLARSKQDPSKDSKDTRSSRNSVGAQMSLSAAPTPTMRAEKAIVAPWSAPLLKDVLTVESQGEDLEVAALGVTLACLALLDEHTVPGWLPALLDEQRCPLSGPVSFCFTEDHGAVPIGVVRSTPQRPMPLAHPRGHTSTSQPAASSSTPPSDSEPAPRRCTNTSCSLSSVSA